MILHILASALIAGGTYGMTKNKPLAFSVAITAGIIKEHIDPRWDNRDMMANTIGTAILITF